VALAKLSLGFLSHGLAAFRHQSPAAGALCLSLSRSRGRGRARCGVAVCGDVGRVGLDECRGRRLIGDGLGSVDRPVFLVPLAAALTCVVAVGFELTSHPGPAVYRSVESWRGEGGDGVGEQTEGAVGRAVSSFATAKADDEADAAYTET